MQAEAASAYVESAECYPADLTNMINEDSYTKQQTTGLLLEVDIHVGLS